MTSDKCVDVFQIDRDFMRTPAVLLLSTLFAALDQYSPHMAEVEGLE